MFPAALYSRGSKDENKKGNYCMEVHIIFLSRLDYEVIVSEENSYHKKKGRTIFDPARIIMFLWCREAESSYSSAKSVSFQGPVAQIPFRSLKRIFDHSKVRFTANLKLVLWAQIIDLRPFRFPQNG